MNLQLVIPGLEKYFPDGEILTNGKMVIRMDKAYKKLKVQAKKLESDTDEVLKKDHKRDALVKKGKMAKKRAVKI